MALPSSGTISMDQIRAELGVSSQSPFSLNAAAGGSYATINTSSPSHPHPADPDTLSEWYGYDHDYSSLGDAPTNFVLDSIGAPYQYKTIWYVPVYLSWDNPYSYPWEIYESASDDVNSAVDSWTGGSGTTTQRDRVRYTEWYYFIRYTSPLSNWTTPGVYVYYGDA
jgi:hypothetical protein